MELPRSYLSWSALNLWKRDKNGFRRKYYEGIEPPHTPYTLFGKEVAERLESDDELSHIPRYKTPELEVRVEVDGVPVLGYLDSFDPKKNRIIEFKTGIKKPDGKPRWTNLEVRKHDQLPFYSLLVEEKFGEVHPDVTLIWLETDWVDAQEPYYSPELDMTLFMQSKKLDLTGNMESFKRTIEPYERDRMRAWIRQSAEEISDDYKLYLDTHE